MKDAQAPSPTTSQVTLRSGRAWYVAKDVFSVMPCERAEGAAAEAAAPRFAKARPGGIRLAGSVERAVSTPEPGRR